MNRQPVRFVPDQPDSESWWGAVMTLLLLAVCFACIAVPLALLAARAAGG